MVESHRSDLFRRTVLWRKYFLAETYSDRLLCFPWSTLSIAASHHAGVFIVWHRLAEVRSRNCISCWENWNAVTYWMPQITILTLRIKTYPPIIYLSKSNQIMRVRFTPFCTCRILKADPFYFAQGAILFFNNRILLALWFYRIAQREVFKYWSKIGQGSWQTNYSSLKIPDSSNKMPRYRHDMTCSVLTPFDA